MIFPAPVLAEPEGIRRVETTGDSRGGENLLWPLPCYRGSARSSGQNVDLAAVRGMISSTRDFMDGNELARIGIGEIEFNVDGNIIRPFRKCYIITTAGQIWDIVVDGFGANNNNLDALWRLKREAWIKR